MNTITLTMEATPENLARLQWIFAAQTKEAQAVTTPAVVASADPTVPEMKAPEVTKTTLRQMGLDLTKAGKAQDLKDALKEFGAEKLSQVKEEDYPALAAKLQEVMS